MAYLNFWLHMDDGYMWRWYCSEPDGTLVAISARSFSKLADAERAADAARTSIGNRNLAA
ncbi:hypothetical protein GCM10022276_03140 [Sphingomonas limnosediminicola]|uniref:DUF1508 domain-containing protein n=1 Tax=Sphingomonas limnosediminicola TaxID=940133 RepID=A0ABP7KT99_9SPHN